MITPPSTNNPCATERYASPPPKDIIEDKQPIPINFNAFAVRNIAGIESITTNKSQNPADVASLFAGNAFLCGLSTIDCTRPRIDNTAITARINGFAETGIICALPAQSR